MNVQLFFKMNILQPIGTVLAIHQTYSYFKTIENDIKCLSDFKNTDNFIYSKNYNIYNKIVIVSSGLFGWLFPKTTMLLTALDYIEIQSVKN
jgi:hypothetical protein